MKFYDSTIQLEFQDLTINKQTEYYKIKDNRKQLIKFVNNLNIKSFQPITYPYKELIAVIDGLTKLIHLNY